MKSSSIFLVAGLTVTGVASAVALGANAAGAVIAASHERGHPGPDSARVEAFLDALHRTDPVICEMVADQLGNFWSSQGADEIGSLADASRRWEETRDSLASPVTDAAARRRLVTSLNDEDVCVRRTAAKMLGQSGELAAGALRDGLRTASPRVREASALALGHAELKGFRGDLERATADESPAVAAMATWALGELEIPETFGRFVELTRSREVRVRRAAAWGVGQLENPKGVNALAALLKDPDPTTRIVAAEALGNLDELHTAPPELIEALGAADLPLRRAAAEALAEIGDVQSVGALGRAMGDADLDTRRAVVRALCEIEDVATVPFLLRAIKDADPEIRKMAAEALGDRKEG